MKKYLFTASVDGIGIDYKTTIMAETEPDFWYCYNLAEEHGCSLWGCEEVTE